MIKIFRAIPEHEKFQMVILALKPGDATTGYCSSVKAIAS